MVLLQSNFIFAVNLVIPKEMLNYKVTRNMINVVILQNYLVVSVSLFQPASQSRLLA